MQAQFHTTLQRLATLKEGDILYEENGQLLVQGKTNPVFGLFRRKKAAACDEKITEILLSLFASHSFVPPEELPGLRFCQRHFASLPSHTPQIKQAHSFCNQYLEPFKVLDLPIDIMHQIDGYCRTFRATSKEAGSVITVQDLFENERLFRRAREGEPQAVRILVKYLLLNVQNECTDEVERRFVNFHRHAAKSTKALFWRAMLLSGELERLPLACITELPLSGSVAHLSKLIKRCPNLERLEINGAKLEGHERELSRALRECKKLSSLCLVTKDPLKDFWKLTLPHMRNLTSLSLEGQNEKIPSLRNLTSLERLSLVGFRNTKQFCDELSHLRSLKSLTLRIAGGPQLLTTIATLTNLEELETSTMRLTTNQIVQTISQLTNLRALTLSNFLNPIDAVSVASLIQQMPHLTKLKIEDVIENLGFNFLTDILQEREMTHLALQFEEEIPPDFATMLLSKKSLRYLSIPDEDFGAAFAEALALYANESNLEVLEYHQEENNPQFWEHVAKMPCLRALQVVGSFSDSNATALQASKLHVFSFLGTNLRGLSQKGARALLRIKTLQECSIPATNSIEVQPVLDTLMRQKHIRSFQLRTTSSYFRGDEKRMSHLDTFILTPADGASCCPRDTITYAPLGKNPFD